jgi:hypothetical protein
VPKKIRPLIRVKMTKDILTYDGFLYIFILQLSRNLNQKYFLIPIIVNKEIVMKKKNVNDLVHALATDVAKTAGVDVKAAEKVLRALNVESHIGDVSSLSEGDPINVNKVKLAYRISSGGIIA